MDGSIILIVILAIGAYITSYQEREIRLFRVKKQLYMSSEEWKQKRQKVLERDNHKCQTCGANYNLDIHHTSYKNVGKEPLEDLVALCRDCHSSLHRQLGYDYDKEFPILENVQ